MRRQTYRKSEPAQGAPSGDRLKISISFPKHDFNDIRLMAHLNKRSFQEQVRVLCRTAMLPSEQCGGGA